MCLNSDEKKMLLHPNSMVSQVLLGDFANASRYCEFGSFKTNADSESYMIRLRFSAGLQKSEHK